MYLKIKRTLKKRSCFSIIYRKLSIIIAFFSYEKASKFKYFATFGRKLNLENPQYFNEKLMKLKFIENNKVKAKYADKYNVKKILSEKGFEEIIIPTIYICDNYENIDWKSLPEKFVIKSTSGSGDNIIVDKQSSSTIDKYNNLMKNWKNKRYDLLSAEPHYKYIKNRIIIEENIANGGDLLDYKMHCFNGNVEFIEVSVNRRKNLRYYYFTPSWNLLPYGSYDSGYLNMDKIKLRVPLKLDSMVNLANELSNNFTYVRIDLYYINNKIYFGEFTFTPSGCLDTSYTKEQSLRIGEKLKIG